MKIISLFSVSIMNSLLNTLGVLYFLPRVRRGPVEVVVNFIRVDTGNHGFKSRQVHHPGPAKTFTEFQYSCEGF